MPFRELIVAIFICVSTLGCASTGQVSGVKEKPECDLTAYIQKFGEGEATCIARTVAKRCTEVDACLIRCQVDGRFDKVGGGCFHMCNYGKDWQRPPEANACSKG